MGQLLESILAEDRACRRKWSRYAVRHSGARVHQAGVAEVLAHWMWENGDAPDTDHDLPRRMKDVVSRALTGKSISPRVLTLFIDAFALPQETADELWSAYWEGPGS